MNLNPLIIALLIVLIYICVYAIINRICTCVENCAKEKSYKRLYDLSAEVQQKQREERELQLLRRSDIFSKFKEKKDE